MIETARDDGRAVRGAEVDSSHGPVEELHQERFGGDARGSISDEQLSVNLIHWIGS